jgi:hypothetical protein
LPCSASPSVSRASQHATNTCNRSLDEATSKLADETVKLRRASGMPTSRDKEHGSASELLADWRSAERDSLAAHEAASVAARAVTAAAAAEEAAVEAESAAREATDAAARAKEAAERAKTAASQAAEAAQVAATTTEEDQARADQTVVAADHAEADARDRFHKAQEGGFPKD